MVKPAAAESARCGEALLRGTNENKTMYRREQCRRCGQPNKGDREITDYWVLFFL